MIYKSFLKIQALTGIALILLFLVSSCQNYSAHGDKISDTEAKTIPVFDLEIIQEIDTIIESYYYVMLETRSECLIGRIDKLIISRDRAVIFDGMSNCIFVFKTNGEFEYRIRQIGKGPGEYDKIIDFEVNESEGQIVLLCTNLNKLLYYDISNGKYIREQKMDFKALAFKINTSGDFLFDCKLSLERKTSINRLLITDSKLNISKEYLPKTNHPSAERTPFTKYNSTIYYSSNYENYIYSYKSKSLYREYLIDFGKRNLEISNLPEHLYTSKGLLDKKIRPFLDFRSFRQYANDNGFAYAISNFLETDAFIRFNFVHKGVIFNALVDKHTGEVRTYQALRQRSALCYDNILTTHDNFYVGSVDSNLLVESIKRKNSEGQLAINLNEIGLSGPISSQDNPALIFVKYRIF